MSEEENVLKDGDTVFIDPKTGERKVNQTQKEEETQLHFEGEAPPAPKPQPKSVGISRTFRIGIAANIAGNLAETSTLDDETIVNRAFKLADMIIIRGQR